MEFNLEFIILSIAIATFSIQVAISDLSDKIKKFLGIQEPYKFVRLTNISSWVKIVGLKWSMILSPFILLMTLFFNIHKFISEMVSCPYCVSYHLAWIVYYVYLDMPITLALLYAPFVLLWVSMVDKIMR